MKQISLIFLIILFFLCGVLLISKPIYYYSKRMVANILLERAWDKSMESNSKIVNPWTWADIYPIAKLGIKSVNLSTIVLNDVSGEALAFGVGHLPSSGKPGKNGNIVISGHRDGVFRKLKDVIVNDIIELESTRKKYQYKVIELIITTKNDTRWIENTDRDILTLITCYPFKYIGNADKRLIVRASIVE